MAGSPWICPRCATPSNVDNCPNCFHERPGGASYNSPGSPFAITQGPQGYSGMNRGCGIAFLIFLIGTLVIGFLRAYHPF